MRLDQASTTLGLRQLLYIPHSSTANIKRYKKTGPSWPVIDCRSAVTIYLTATTKDPNIETKRKRGSSGALPNFVPYFDRIINVGRFHGL